MSSYTENLNLFKYNTSSDGNLTFSINNALNDNWDKIDKAYGKSRRNIGEIVQSTIPLTDAGLHLLDGSLIYGDGIYADFVDYIASIYDASSSYFCSESAWQTSISTYGACGKFVYDSTNNTVRLPQIVGFTEGEINPANLGNLTEAGLPNITGNLGVAKGESTAPNGAFYYDGKGKKQGMDYTVNGIGMDASRSNSIYGNSTTVQPQSIKVLYYIVVANSTKTEIQVDIDEVVTDLNNRTNRYNFDGQWVQSRFVVSTATAVGSREHDLSTYLPNDNYSYEVYFTMGGSTASGSSGGTCGLVVGTMASPEDNSCISGVIYVTKTSTSGRNVFTIPIDTNRKVYSQIVTHDFGTAYFAAIGYRRIGTNT